VAFTEGVGLVADSQKHALELVSFHAPNRAEQLTTAKARL
jgi:hypothetical protein